MGCYCSLCTVYCCICGYFLRDIIVDDTQPLKSRIFHPWKPSKEAVEGTVFSAIKEISKQPRFQRVLILTFIFCGVRSTFRHLDATFPKYFTREFGEHAHFELVIA